MEVSMAKVNKPKVRTYNIGDYKFKDKDGDGRLSAQDVVSRRGKKDDFESTVVNGKTFVQLAGNPKLKIGMLYKDIKKDKSLLHSQVSAITGLMVPKNIDEAMSLGAEAAGFQYGLPVLYDGLSEKWAVSPNEYNYYFKVTAEYEFPRDKPGVALFFEKHGFMVIRSWNDNSKLVAIDERKLTAQIYKKVKNYDTVDAIINGIKSSRSSGLL